MSKLIQLGGHRYKNSGIKGYSIVSDEDYGKINQYKWSLSKIGYAVRRPKIGKVYRIVYLHREIMGNQDKMKVDHINRNKLDNRRENLRLCTDRESVINRGVGKNSKIKLKGVWFDKRDGSYSVFIGSAGINRKYIGRFNNTRDAAIAYNKSAKEFYGDFAVLNKIPRKD